MTNEFVLKVSLLKNIFLNLPESTFRQRNVNELSHYYLVRRSTKCTFVLMHLQSFRLFALAQLRLLNRPSFSYLKLPKNFSYLITGSKSGLSRRLDAGARLD
jgi:hypothetical protein